MEPPSRAATFAVWAQVFLAIGQGALLMTDAGRTRDVGLALAFVACGLGCLRTSARIRQLLLIAVSALAVANFGWHLRQSEPPFPFRIGQVAVLAGYAGLGLAGAATLLRAPAAQSLLLASVLAIAVVGAETALSRDTAPARSPAPTRAPGSQPTAPSPPSPTSTPGPALAPALGPAPAPETTSAPAPTPTPTLTPTPAPGAVPVTVTGRIGWFGGPVSHPQLGEYYAPESTVRTIYPSNPRGYFDDETSAWFLEIHSDGSKAALRFPGDAPGRLRVDITGAVHLTPFGIYLSQPHIPVAGGQYTLSFKARADAPRQFSYGVSRAHEPWSHLGFVAVRGLVTTWQTFSDVITLEADENARIHFELGASSASVDLEDVVLRKYPSGEPVGPVRANPEYSVTYKFNSLGCRGPDYPIPRPAGRRRIVAVGDSFTLGVGVHEQDTFSAQLQRRLGERRPGVYEVINCGVSGYATREERLHYELIGSKYEPEVVLISFVSNDDVSWRDEVRLGYVHTPGKFESLFETFRLFQIARHQGRRRFDYSASMGELRLLIASVRARGARLAVAAFSGPPTLREGIMSVLRGTDVPFLQLDVEGPNRHVHPLDEHPNDVAHAQAAEKIEAFLARHGLIDLD